MKSYTIGPGDWVRCVHALPASEMKEGAIYKVVSIHKMDGRCNGPPDHVCNNYAVVLTGVTYPACSTYFRPVRPQGPQLLLPLMGIRVPKNQQGPKT